MQQKMNSCVGISPSSAVYGIRFPNLAQRITELGGLWKVCDCNKSRYSAVYISLNYGSNPNKKTIDYLLAKTGLTYEQAFKEA